MARRDIDEEVVRRVLAADPSPAAKQGRQIRQAVLRDRGRSYLVRVIIEVQEHEAVVVTAYRTSKLGKYGAEP